MAVTHAKPGEVIDIRPFGSSLPAAKTTALFKTQSVEVIRMVMPTGKEISEHEAPGTLIVQCLEGRVAFTASGKTEELHAGQLLYLEAQEPHAVRCIEDASFLLTILSNQ
jgi:quercetin dioxygenase-like cupin family protein